MSLVFGGTGESLGITDYTNASFDTDPDDNKSQYGYVFLVNKERCAGGARNKQLLLNLQLSRSTYLL
jgi:hypothetical protein